MSHPPFAHNPHAYDGIDPDGNATSGLVVHSAVQSNDDPVLEGEHGPELTDLPDGQEVSVDEGSEPSANPSQQETGEPAGTGSSPSSKQDANSGSSGAKPRRKPARAAAGNSGPEATTDSSSAGSTAGAGTDQ